MAEYAPDDLESCPDHPAAMIRHIYDADFYVMNGERVGTGMNRRTVGYQCAACGRALRMTAGRAALANAAERQED